MSHATQCEALIVFFHFLDEFSFYITERFRIDRVTDRLSPTQKSDLMDLTTWKNKKNNLLCFP